MKLRHKGQPASKEGRGRHQPSSGRRAQPPRLAKAQREIAGLRRRVVLLENEIQETRQLNKRLAEITDVIAEVLLPVERRDEDRLRAILSKYDSTL